MLVVLIGVSTWLQFVVVNNLSGQMLTIDGVWHFREVFSSRINPDLNFAALRPIDVLFIHDHHLMLQHDDVRPHIARICIQFLENENIPVLAWPAYSPIAYRPLSMFGMLWIGVYDSVFQFLPISSNFAQPFNRSGPTFHRQSTTWSTLC